MHSAKQPEFPRSPKFYATIVSAESKGQITQLYAASGWSIRECTWSDYEIRCSPAELIVEGDGPTRLHGLVVDVVANTRRLLQTPRDAGIGLTAESDDANGHLIEQGVWSDAS